MEVVLASEPAPDQQANEDFVAATSNAVVLLDGAGDPTGQDSGCSHGVAWLVRQLGGRLLASLASEPGRPLAELLADAIGDVAALHAGTCDLAHPGSPSATVALVRERDGLLDHLVLADSTVALEHAGGKVEPISDDRIGQTARAARAPVRPEPIGSAAHRRRLAARIRELQRYRNRPGGFWVASTMPEAAWEALTGTVPAEQVVRVGVVSDGAARIVDRFGLLGWAQALELADREGPQALIGEVRAAERSDPQGRRWPRGKRFDDASMALCRVGPATPRWCPG